ncbi:hypothetical protein F5B22DRAFT_417995 [Xylaria bambusicola]|uniref:uncharacterized protein n=1 Tax=Xylaria bambusicola TaxID=326684 RepID=UPI002007E6D7|nr:uncharacterized protein F5B22DRAFT_417995 [Xylaria bambusicola]KAI0523808.1 hypothetical protein F5B22DRAFT_417995 [Xylaria bambusicola]
MSFFSSYGVQQIQRKKILSTWTFTLTDYASQCHKFLLDGGRHVSVSTHADVVEIISQIHQDKERTSLHQEVSKKLVGGSSPNTHNSVNGSLNLCSRLLIMTSIGEPPLGTDGPNTIHWDAGTLRDFTSAYFGPASNGGVKLHPDNAQIGRIFTALNLTRIGGMRIEWTRNLADHLRLVDDDKTVSIFDCAAFLKFQRAVDNPLFPPAFVDETLRTLSLLLPQNDSRTASWLAAQVATHDLDPALAECGSLNARARRFENFVYWHDRLVVLRQALDEARPQTLSQWWHDRRNGVQWYTFWVAILVFLVTIFFGLVQSVEGALQVYLSWQALGQDG